MNNPFAPWGIEHLSASSINGYINNPCKWIVNYLLKYRGPGNGAMWRGTCTDSAVGNLFGMHENQKKPVPEEEIYTVAEQQYFGLANYWQEQSPAEFDDAKTERELDTMKRCVELAIPFYKNLGKPTSYQEKIEVEFDEIPVPIIGYTDLVYEEGEEAHYAREVRDIKTVARRPKEIPANVCRQLSVYAVAKNARPMVDYVYASKRDGEVITMVVNGADKHLKDVRTAALAITNLLSYSDDINQIASLFFPNYDDWMWSEGEIAAAKKLWS